MNARVLALTILLLLAAFLSDLRAVPGAPDAASARTVLQLDEDWRFSKGDFSAAMMLSFDDKDWRPVNLPHDWSSEGPFSSEYASGTGYAPGGLGWYRKHFTVNATETNKLVTVEFDGVYDHAEVWFNGQFVGSRPYGYSSFECVLTPLVRFGADNVLAVRVDHSRYADSRWYTGSGIYRHVRLRLTEKLRIAHWGVFITTPEITAASATVQIQTTLENGIGEEQSFALETEALAPDGRSVAHANSSTSLRDGNQSTIIQRLRIPTPQLWSPDSPWLYTLKSRLRRATTTIDETATSFGIRTLRFDHDKGFFLNGTAMKLKGVCLHHDAGCLGAAVPDSVLERRLRLLKELGANAIRTSHNPPAPELLDLCDRLGFLVMDEAFDEFTPGKNKWVAGRNNGEPSHFGYAELFEQWSVRDISDMVRRDRNHPSIIMWSIGNEIDYRNDPFSDPVLGNEYRPGNPPAQEMAACARPLITAVKQLDPTRPVTAALATVSMSDAVGLAQMLDVVGYNYQEARYADDHRKYPQRFIYGSENSGGWAQWSAVRDNDYVGGQFLWTGIDYLGEAGRWPNRGSRAGLLDLCGFKKPVAWFRQSLWSSKPMVYLCASMPSGFIGQRGSFGRFGGQESWNWPSNSLVNVHCYTISPQVELRLNGRVIGTKQASDLEQGALNWRIPFEPGVLEARGQRNGHTESVFTLKTAGPAQQLQLVPEEKQLRANGSDVWHVEFRIVDAQGVRVPDAGNEVKFTVEGPARLLGIENGDLNDPATGKDGVRHAFHGRGLAFVQSTHESGVVRITARGEGLKEASVEITPGPSRRR